MLPLLKWAGGKRKIVGKISELVDFKNEGTYYEPFFGGGALLFHLLPNSAVCFDFNEDLINFYNTVKANPEKLISELKKNYVNKNNKEDFYIIRALDRDEKIYSKMNNVQKAARMMYLNKTCYNGLWRVNSKGQNNVPFGRYVRPKILDEEAIRSTSEYFNEKNITFISGDFEKVEKYVNENDFIYFDPPYDVEKEENGFVDYTKLGFNRDDQIRLKNLCDRLITKGAKVAISNSKTKFILNLYRDDEYNFYTINDNIKVRRYIGPNGSSRKVLDEILIIGSQDEKNNVSTSKLTRKNNNNN